MLKAGAVRLVGNLHNATFKVQFAPVILRSTMIQKDMKVTCRLIRIYAAVFVLLTLLAAVATERIISSDVAFLVFPSQDQLANAFQQVGRFFRFPDSALAAPQPFVIQGKTLRTSFAENHRRKASCSYWQSFFPLCC